jgi:hypothetical protein
MKAGFKVLNEGTGCYILVQNYHSLNEVVNYYFTYYENIKKDYCSVGVWKVKQLK